ncbi:hypothetical protein Bbelb_122000, partial [Branchiostoma belcheri]
WHSSGDWASGVDYGFYDSEGAFDAEGGGVAAEAVDDYAVIANADTLITRLAGQDTSDKVIPTVIVGIGEPMDDDIVFENEEASSLPQQPTTLATTRSVERATPPPAPLTPVITCQELYCYGGGTCVFNGREGATCHCPLGRQGYQCQEEVEVRYPRFQGESFLSFPQLVASNMRFRVSLEFKAESLDGLLMFSGKYRDGRGDFFSIALVNGRVQFRILLKFKAESLDGLLMFSGKYRDGRGDFFSIALVNGHVQFSGKYRDGRGDFFSIALVNGHVQFR